MIYRGLVAKGLSDLEITIIDMRLLVLNFHTTASTLLDVNHNYYYATQKCAIDAFPGWDIYVHNPYVREKNWEYDKSVVKGIITNDYIKQNGLNEFDACFSMMPTLVGSVLVGRSNFGVCTSMVVVINALKHYKGRVYNLSNDYKFGCGTIAGPHSKYLEPGGTTSKDPQLLADFIELFECGTIQTCACGGLDEEGVPALYFDSAANYWQYAPKVPTFNAANKTHDFIYSAIRKPDRRRAESLENITKGFNRALVGSIRFKKWPSLTNYSLVTFSEAQKLANKAVFELVVASEWHDFLTTRAIDSFSNGQVMLCDAKYKVFAEFCRQHGLADRIVASSDDVEKLVGANYQKLYQEQYEVTEYLRKGNNYVFEF